MSVYFRGKCIEVGGCHFVGMWICRKVVENPTCCNSSRHIENSIGDWKMERECILDYTSNSNFCSHLLKKNRK